MTTSGFGIVTSNTGGISCPLGCTATYTEGTMVTLTATPSANQTFHNWSGACTGTTSPCVVTMSAAETVNAEFSETYPTSATPVTESFACVATTPLGPEDVTLSATFQGAPPTNVPPGATFNMALFQVVATVPAAFANDVTQYGYNSVSGSATTIMITSNDATNKSVNAVTSDTSGYDFGPIALTADQGFSISLPASAVTVPGAWQAKSTDGTISFAPGAVDVSLTFTGGEFGNITSAVTCSAPTTPAVFATTTTP